jgi:hypothetical protein
MHGDCLPDNLLELLAQSRPSGICNAQSKPVNAGTVTTRDYWRPDLILITSSVCRAPDARSCPNHRKPKRQLLSPQARNSKAVAND